MGKIQIKEKQRLDYIDTIKGIGIILVVIGHYLLYADRLVEWIYSFHMPLFFMITGYLSEYKKDKCDDIKLLVVNKAKSLMYPYVTFSLINIIWYIVFFIILPIDVQPSDTFKVILLRTLSTMGYNALWFLPTLFTASILFNIINKTRFSHLIHIIIMILGCAVSVFVVQPILYSTEIWCVLHYIIFRTMIATSFIYIGSLVCKLLTRLNGITEWICIGVSVLVMITTLIVNVTQRNSYSIAWANVGNPFIFYISAISTSLSILLIFKKINLKKGLLNFYGKNSLIIMAIHMGFPIDIARLIVRTIQCPFSDRINSIIFIVIEFIIMTVCILLINKYFKFILRLPNKSKNNISSNNS